MKKPKNKLQNSKQELDQLPDTRFVHFVKHATVIAIILAAIIIALIVANYNIGNTSHQNNTKQLITVLIWMLIFGGIWYVIGPPLKRRFSPITRKANKVKDFVADTARTFFKRDKTHNKQSHKSDSLHYDNSPLKEEDDNNESTNVTNNDIYQAKQSKEQDNIKYPQDDNDDDLF